MSKRTRQFLIVACLIACAVSLNASALNASPALPAPPDQGGVVLYVDDDAQLGGDGLSWQTAHRFLQDALAIAADPKSGVTEIRIAQGIYKPDQGTGYTPGNREHTFSIPSGISVRGGYAGMIGDDPDARNWDKYESICSGDLLGNDGPPGSFQNYGDNSFHVVSMLNVQDVVIEGLTVTAGDAPGSELGGGLLAVQSGLVIEFCTFSYNRSNLRGGGVAPLGSDTSIQNCKIYGNRAGSNGGGIWAGRFVGLPNGGSLSVADCVFTNNGTFLEDGGALYTFEVALHITRCNFMNNGAGDEGGAVAFESNPPTTKTWIEDSSFTGNHGSDAAGALHIGNNTSTTVLNCAFIGNTAGNQGGAVRSNAFATFINCLFADNFCSFAGGAAWQGGGTLINCDFRRNLCGFGSGGGAARASLDTTFVNCSFSGNDCWAAGGAIYINPATGPLPERTGTIINCSFTNNITLTGQGGAIAGNAIIRNSILWSNSPGELSGPADVQFSCIEGGWPGEGNIDADPIFIDPFGPDGIPGTADDDLRLRGGSPCIDAGDNTVVPSDDFDLDGDGNITEPIPFDLNGKRRFRNDPHTVNTGIPGFGLPAVDMGAAEFQLRADINQDGIVNVNDLLQVINLWGPCTNPGLRSCPADIAPYPEGDGSVNHQDLLEVILSWGQ